MVTTVYHDAETGFTFSEYAAQYTLGRTIKFRIAVPSPVSSDSPYDAVLQVVAPVDVGWTGLAWGGRMLGNPLTVSWSNGNSVLLSSRRARYVLRQTTALPRPLPLFQYFSPFFFLFLSLLASFFD